MDKNRAQQTRESRRPILDAVAKRRDDSTEIGELKRLVTVLLQEIDTWPEGSLLLAATNHGDLLDPAVWRRFEMVIDFPLPDRRALEAGIQAFLDADIDRLEVLTNAAAPPPARPAKKKAIKKSRKKTV